MQYNHFSSPPQFALVLAFVMAVAGLQIGQKLGQFAKHELELDLVELGLGTKRKQWHESPQKHPASMKYNMFALMLSSRSSAARDLPSFLQMRIHLTAQLLYASAVG